MAEPTSLTRPDPALPKARSLVRRDHIHGMEMAPGEITAVVEHNGTHHVRVQLPVWSEHQLEHARKMLTGGSDDLSDAVHTALVQDGQPPGPKQSSVTATCSCRTRKRPCAHILAAFFDIARHLDHRPRLALGLRGMSDAHSTTTARIPIGLLDPAHFYESKPAGSGGVAERR